MSLDRSRSVVKAPAPSRWARPPQGHPPSGGFTRPDGVWIDPPRWRKATAWGRMRPAFLIIGAQRSGTTSLYRYLCTHPDVLPALRKEVHYYDFQFGKGRAWYGAHYPLRRRWRSPPVTGEGSPYYMVHPLAPTRARAHNPQLKIIAVLRDPVERAHSQYRHERANGHEQLGFEEAIDAEAERLAGCDARLRCAPDYYCYNHHHFSYLDRGRYGHHLSRWAALFPAKQMLVLSAETLFANPNRAANETFAFLGLAPHEIGAVHAHNQRRYPALSAEERIQLGRHFEEDQKLLAGVFRNVANPHFALAAPPWGEAIAQT